LDPGKNGKSGITKGQKEEPGEGFIKREFRGKGKEFKDQKLRLRVQRKEICNKKTRVRKGRGSLEGARLSTAGSKIFSTQGRRKELLNDPEMYPTAGGQQEDSHGWRTKKGVGKEGGSGISAAWGGEQLFTYSVVLG